jgi:PPOX class probable F420-dependent enzyme
MASTALRPGATLLDTATTLSLATVRPDGQPHVIPLWFLRDGDALVVLTKPHAQKVRNLVAEPRAMVSVGPPGVADARLLEVIGEVEAGGAAALADRLRAKYQHQFSALGVTVGEFVETYPFVIRLRPTRWLPWGGPGWERRDGLREQAPGGP